MGGRGGGSGIPSGSPVRTYGDARKACFQEIDAAKDLNEINLALAKYAQYDIGKSLQNLDLDVLKGMAKAAVTVKYAFAHDDSDPFDIMDTYKGFTKAYNSTLNHIGGGEHRSNAYASAKLYGGDINVNPAMFKSLASVSAQYQQDVRYGFHPSGTNWTHIISHELGHKLVAALDKTTNSPILSWNNNTTATSIVREAVKNLKRSGQYGNTKTDQFVRQVSQYAMKNRHETVAESVADYMANGNSAKPLSIAVVTELKQRLRSNGIV